MKVHKTIFALIAICAAICSFNGAALAGNGGTINMGGSIVETTCTIDVNGNDYQRIALNEITVNQFISRGQRYDHKFYVRLQNCALQAGRQYYQIAFNGNAEGKYFVLEGDLQGVTMQIIDAHGNEAVPGVFLPIQSAEMDATGVSVPFYLRFVGMGELHAGTFMSTVFFNVDYF
ncbi:fimbrial protein [Pseudescherichia vulneris]